MVSCFCFLALYDSVSYFNGCVIISISFQVINLLKKLQGKKSSIELVIFKMILINCGLGNTAHLFLLRLSWRFLNNFPRMWCVWCQNVNGIKNIVMWDTFSNIIFFGFIYGRLFNENFDTWSFSPRIPRILRASSLSSATMEETNKNQVIWSRVLTKSFY